MYMGSLVLAQCLCSNRMGRCALGRKLAGRWFKIWPRGERSSSAVPPFSPSDPEALEICSGGLEPPRWSPATVHRDDDGRCDVSEYAAATNLKGSSIVRYPAPRLRCTESILAVLRSLGCLSLSQKMLATMCEPFVAGVDNGCHRSGPTEKRIKQMIIFFF